MEVKLWETTIRQVQHPSPAVCLGAKIGEAHSIIATYVSRPRT